MRWYKANLFTLEVVDQDEMRKPVTAPVEAGACLVRYAPSQPDDVDVAGNDQRLIRKTLLAKKPYSQLAEIKELELKGDRWTVTRIDDLEGEVAIHIERSK